MENTDRVKRNNRFLVICATIIIGVFVLFFCLEHKNSNVGGNSALEVQSPTQIVDQQITENQIIKYEVFRDYGSGARKVILVSEKATKEEVLKLASYLKINYMTESNGWVFIEIFDLKEAFLNQTNLNYPEKKYFKHFLVDAGNNPNTGTSWLDWVAEGRDH